MEVMPNDDEPDTVVEVLPVEASWLGVIEGLCHHRTSLVKLGLGLQARQVEGVLRAITKLRRGLSVPPRGFGEGG